MHLLSKHFTPVTYWKAHQNFNSQYKTSGKNVKKKKRKWNHFLIWDSKDENTRVGDIQKEFGNIMGWPLDENLDSLFKKKLNIKIHFIPT